MYLTSRLCSYIGYPLGSKLFGLTFPVEKFFIVKTYIYFQVYIEKSEYIDKKNNCILHIFVAL